MVSGKPSLKTVIYDGTSTYPISTSLLRVHLVVSFSDRTYRDLQKLAVKLGLNARGTREEVIDRLIQWHKRQFNADRRCAGSNFMLLEVELPPSPPKDANGNSRGGVSPALLSPLKSKPRRNADGSPISILASGKKKSAQKKNINFSIFNGTKIIPPRERIHHQWLREDGIADPEEWLEHDSDEELDDIAQEIAAAGSGCGVAFSSPHTSDKRTSLCEDDWLSSDLNLPADSPYAKQPLARSNTQPMSRQPNFDCENEEVAPVRASAAKPLTASPAKNVTMAQPRVYTRPLIIQSQALDNELTAGLAGLTM